MNLPSFRFGALSGGAPNLFRLALMGLLGAALIATLVSLVLGTSRYLRTPDGVVHARKAPKAKAVSPEEFLEKLTSAPTPGEGAGEAKAAEGSKPVEGEKAAEGAHGKYLEQVKTLQKCGRAFNKKIGRDEPEAEPAAVEDFRTQFEKIADASPDRGERWADDVAQFACATLDEKDAAVLGKAGKFEEPLITAINFHILRWDEARRKVHEFEAQEKRRVEQETAAEARRIEEARNGTSAALNAAATSFAVFLALGVCLILSGIESALRGMQRSLEQLANRDFSVQPLAVTEEDVHHESSGGHHHPIHHATPSGTIGEPMMPNEPREPTINFDDVALADPLEVEYEIPAEALTPR